MHYIPKKIRDIDEKLSDATIPEPAAHMWDAIKGKRGVLSIDKMIEVYIESTDRQKKTKKLEDLLKKVVKELEKGGFLYKFGNEYYPVLNALNEE